MPARLPLAPYPDDVWRRALEHRGLVATIARRFLGRGLGPDDLMHEGLVGVCRALTSYDPAGARFGDYAGGWVVSHLQQAVHRGQMVRYPFRATRGFARDGALPLPPGFDLEAPACPDPDEPTPERRVASLLARLDPLSRRVLESHFGLGGAPPRTFAQLARDLGISRERASRLEREAMAALRDAAPSAGTPPSPTHAPSRDHPTP